MKNNNNRPSSVAFHAHGPCIADVQPQARTLEAS